MAKSNGGGKFFFLRLSCFILEIQLPHLFGVVINVSDSFKLHLHFLYRGRAAIFFHFALPHGHALLAAVRDEVEIVRRRGKERKQRKEAAKGRVKGRKEKTGLLAVFCCSVAKSHRVPDVNKLICQREVFTRLGFLLGVTHAASDADWPAATALDCLVGLAEGVTNTLQARCVFYQRRLRTLLSKDVENDDVSCLCRRTEVNMQFKDVIVLH